MTTPSARIAERLLRGWTLTAETCPDRGCRCPLMRERRTANGLASEGDYYCAEKDDIVFVDDAAAPTSSGRAGDVDAYDSRRDARLGAFADVDVDEELLDDDDDDDDVEHGVIIRYGIDHENDGDITILADLRDEVAAMRELPTTRTSPSDVGAPVDVSGAIAEKLLQGWTLTNDTCPMPACATPLVRNRQREMFCVKHDMFVRAAAAAAAAAATFGEHPNPPPGTHAAAAAAAAAAPSRTHALDDDITASERATIAALESKLAAARAALNAETDASRCDGWLALIERLHAAMRALAA